MPTTMFSPGAVIGLFQVEPLSIRRLGLGSATRSTDLPAPAGWQAGAHEHRFSSDRAHRLRG